MRFTDFLAAVILALLIVSIIDPVCMQYSVDGEKHMACFEGMGPKQ